MKTNRRDFLKMASMAFASIFAPKLKVEPELERSTYAITGETLPDETTVEWPGYPAASWEWISVEDRAPTLDDGYKFLAYSKKFGYVLATVSLCDGGEGKSVTHWMPLPGEPDKPKRDQDDSLEILVDPDSYERFKNALDACDCQFDVQVHYGQCEEPEAFTCENCNTYYFCPARAKGHVCDDWDAMIGMRMPLTENRHCTLEKCCFSIEAECDGCVYFSDEYRPRTIWESIYARELGKATLTIGEKQQAFLNHIIEKYEEIASVRDEMIESSV